MLLMHIVIGRATALNCVDGVQDMKHFDNVWIIWSDFNVICVSSLFIIMICVCVTYRKLHATLLAKHSSFMNFGLDFRGFYLCDF